MTNQQLTVNLKFLACALDLNRKNIAEIVSIGGVDVSASRADSWLRSAGATKNATGNSTDAGLRTNRTSTITEPEFTAFCKGLKPWLESQAD